MSDSAPYEDWSRRLGLTRFLKITRAITLVQAGKNTPPLKKGREARGERRKHFLQQVENLRSAALVGGCAIPFGIASLHASGNSALAQSNIVPDATLGAESSVVLNLNDLAVELIEGGAQRGQNLFHSFEEFNVSEGRGSFFFSPDEAIQNILVRVTGGNRSEILGRLVTFGNSEPNLFLINPNGITFGGNAGFFGGSFVASTANSVVFDNGFEFSTTNSQVPPLLSINVPLGLQFGANPGSIVTQSAASLFVQPGSTLALVGSEVVLDGGRLLAPDGRVELGSVAANSRVNLIATNTGYALGYESTEDFQDIRLLRNAFVYAGGEEGGSIQVQGRNVTLTDGSIIGLLIEGAAVGASLSVNASESVQVIGRSADGQLGSALFASFDSDSTGDLGNLTINTSRLLISDGASVSASNFGSGDGSNLTVNASESVQVIGTSADGQFLSRLSALAAETSNAGNLTIITGRLLILDGGQVSTATFGAGKGGLLTVNASQDVQVSGESTDARFSSALSVQTEGTGDAGNLNVTTPVLLVRDGAQVSAGTRSTGRGGNLIVNASQEVQLIGISADGQSSSGLFSSTLFGATAGNLTITTRQMSVRDGARVTVSSPQGQAGSLSITADSLTLNRGTISAETAKSDAQGGANINLSSLELLRLDKESLISATALEDANGGNITIDSTLIVATPPTASEGSDITANAIQGNGGSVTITTQGLFGIEFRENRTPQNDITVSSEFGISGVFEQNTPGIDPSRGLAELPTDVVNAAAMIDRHCSAGEAAQRSTFVVTGRGGLPPNPNDTLQGEAVVTNWVTLDPQEENINSPNLDANPSNTAPKQLVEAQGWVYGPDGQVILVAQAPTPTPKSPWQTAPSCGDSDWR
jgi:filamentous hemagglutinin family protein